MNKTISLCMLVKNEEKNLDKVLKDIYNLFDEIVIVDTGSTDKTLDIVRNYTKKIYSFKFDNDFSKARNYLISKASSDYIFILDSDEKIKKEYIIKLRELLNFTNNKDVYFINIFENLNGLKYQELQARLFRNISKISYNYAVYENIYDSIKTNNLTYLTLDSIYIEHFKFEDLEKVKLDYSHLTNILENYISKDDLEINEKLYYILKLINIYTTYYFIGYERVTYLINYFFELSKKGVIKNNIFIPKDLFFNTYLIGMLYKKQNFDMMEEIAHNIYLSYKNSLNIIYYLFIIYVNKNNKEKALKYVNQAKSLIAHKTYFKFEPLILDYIDEQFNKFLSEVNNNFRLTQENIKNKKIDVDKNISLCILSLDNNLNSNLEKVFDYFDEVIIVFAKKLNQERLNYKNEKIKTFELPFNNDISELKNFAISVAESNYILFLNSYEFISEDDVNNLKNYCYNTALYGLKLNIFEYDSNNNLIDVKNEIRFFKNDNKIFFNNRIFENVNLSIFNEINQNFLSIKVDNEIKIIKYFSHERESRKLELINAVVNQEEDLLNKLFFYYKKFLIEKYFNYKNSLNSLLESFKLINNGNFNILSYNNELSKYLIDISKITNNNEKNEKVVIDLYNTNISIFPWEYKTYQELGELFFNKKDFINSKFYLHRAIELINSNPIYIKNKPNYVQNDLNRINKIISEMNKKNGINLVIFSDKQKHKYKDKFENVIVVKNNINEIFKQELNFNYFLILKEKEEIIFNKDKIVLDNIENTALVKLEYENLIWYENRILSEKFFKDNFVDVNSFICFNKENIQIVDNFIIKTLNNPYKDINDCSDFDKNNIKSLIYYSNLLNEYLEKGNPEFENIIKLFDNIENIPPIYYLKGLKLLKEEKYKEAIKYFNMCIELGSENTFYPYIPFDKGILSYLSMYQIAICYLKQNKNQLAKIFFEQAIEENEDFEKAKLELENLR